VRVYESSTMRAARFSSMIARAASAIGRNCVSSVTSRLVSESSASQSEVRRIVPLCHHLAGAQIFLHRKGFASVAAIDAEDDRPPSLRKADLKKEKEQEDVKVLRAFLRSESGKIWCKKARRLGLVPSILFEAQNGHLGGNKMLVSLERKELDDIVNKIGRTFFLSRAYDLEIYDLPGGELLSRERVLPRTVCFTILLLNSAFDLWLKKGDRHFSVKLGTPHLEKLRI
jgi:hypothetical protein